MGVSGEVFELVERFDRNLKAYRSGKYSETQVRGDVRLSPKRYGDDLYGRKQGDLGKFLSGKC